MIEAVFGSASKVITLHNRNDKLDLTLLDTKSSSQRPSAIIANPSLVE